MTLHFGEKAALDAYHDFCKLQQEMIQDLKELVVTLSHPQVAFPLRQPPMTELDEEKAWLEQAKVDPQEVEELLRESGFYNPTVEHV